MTEKFVPFHQHLLVRCFVENPPRRVDELNSWFEELVTAVDMKRVAGPTSVYVDEPGNEGLTGTVTLATSHSSVHVWDVEEPYLIQFDIYSCRVFSLDTVMKMLERWGRISADWMMIDRNDGLRVVEGGRYVSE